MKKELESRYNPKNVEERLYDNWLEKGYFNAAVDNELTPYTIMLPPPNITGQLHIGHAFEATLIDILIRHKRMQGYNALWMPGVDHAAIATEVRIVEEMAKEGITKADLGRADFLKRAWAWYDKYGSFIINQLQKMGASCDWERTRFTMDAGLSDAVLEVFVKLYEKGAIYRGERLVNWCTECKTSISDAEVLHEEKQSGFWYFKYPIENSTDEYVEFATTRPETMLGDVAIAINPTDTRHNHLIGKIAIMPITGRKLDIIADDYVKHELGTGMVKITPAHDFNDFDIASRHGLPLINIMNDDGTINEFGGDYAGLDRYDARKRIIDEMDKLGLFIKKEETTNAVGSHDRCKTVVEPLLKMQWYVAMQSLAKPALDAYKSGALNIVPPRFGKIYSHWLENIKDWCISRQLWWGHQIPAYYCRADDCGHIAVAKSAPAACPKCGHGAMLQDEDSLDTWFSSALWPFSTLGWPNDTPELKYFYPTNVLCCGGDILFFWVIRMVFSGVEFTGQLPFKDVFLHGLVRDDKGRKFSKSLGNGLDPLDVINDYGADALRFALATGNTPGNDLRFYIEKVESARNFLNKIWNSARFIMMNMDDDNDNSGMDFGNDNQPDISELTTADKWIISTINRLAKDVTQNLDNYELGVAADKVYSFMWDEFCDWYIEMAKPRLYEADPTNKEGAATKKAALWTLKHVLTTGLKLLHPFIPFITEEIYTTLNAGLNGNDDSIMISQWPKFDDALNFPNEEKEIEQLKQAIKAIRNARAGMNVPPGKKANIFVVTNDDDNRKVYEHGAKYIMALAYGSGVFVQGDKTGIDDNALAVAVYGAEIFIPLQELIDIDKERQRLKKEVEKYNKELDRLASKLGNPAFLTKAPDAVIQEEKAKQDKYEQMLNTTNAQLENLEKLSN